MGEATRAHPWKRRATVILAIVLWTVCRVHGALGLHALRRAGGSTRCATALCCSQQRCRVSHAARIWRFALAARLNAQLTASWAIGARGERAPTLAARKAQQRANDLYIAMLYMAVSHAHS